MAEQLDRLLEISWLPNVTMQVLPLAVGILRAHAGHFALLEIPPELGSDVVHIEGHAGNSYLDTPSDVRLYREMFTDVLANSLPPAGSREVITSYRARHTPH